MNWIKVLYPRPHIELRGFPWIIAKVHGKAMLIAYYAAQTLALVGLTLIYFLVILPCKFFILTKSPAPQPQKSYLLKSDPLASMDFERMY